MIDSPQSSSFFSSRISVFSPISTSTINSFPSSSCSSSILFAASNLKHIGTECSRRLDKISVKSMAWRSWVSSLSMEAKTRPWNLSSSGKDATIAPFPSSSIKGISTNRVCTSTKSLNSNENSVCVEGVDGNGNVDGSSM